MGGHGGYVWAAYGITLLIIGVIVVRPWLANRALQSAIRHEVLRRRAVESGSQIDSVGQATETGDADDEATAGATGGAR